MAEQVVVRPLIIEIPAKLDLADALTWYRSIRPGLDVDFRQSLRVTMRKIASHPCAYGIVDQDLRRALVDHFPYAVFYRDEPEAIRVFAVLHTSRNPRIWKTRLE